MKNIYILITFLFSFMSLGFGQVQMEIQNVNINADNSGTLDIHMTNNSFCSYCSDASSDASEEALCESYGGTWIVGDATIENAETCSGVCTNETGTDVSQFQNEDPCQVGPQFSNNGICSNPDIYAETACEAEGFCSDDSGTCSDPTITVIVACEAAGEIWTFTYDTREECIAIGICSIPSIYNQFSCEEDGGTWTEQEPPGTWTSTETWTENTWTPSELGGFWFDGKVKGLQFFLEGMTISAVSGGVAESELDFLTFNSPADCDADGIADTGCNWIMAVSFGTAYIPTGSDQLLFSASFTDYNNVGICFTGTEVPSGVTPDVNWSPAVLSDIYGIAIPTNWGDCYYANDLVADVNGDGFVNVQDIILIVNMILNDDYSTVADVNNDGELNILDIVNVINIILDN